MTSRSRRLLLLWLGLSLAGAGWLAAQTLAERKARFLQDTSITHRLLSQKAVQHEAVLATLAVLPQAPPPAALFPGLRSALPQLLALGRWHDGRWHGDGAAPPGLADAVARAVRPHHPLALPSGDGRYWLADASGWAGRWPSTKRWRRVASPSRCTAGELWRRASGRGPDCCCGVPFAPGC